MCPEVQQPLTRTGRGLGGGPRLGCAVHLILSQRLLSQVVLPLHFDLHRLWDVRHQEVQEPADGENHMLGAEEGTHPPKRPEWPSQAQAGQGSSTCSQLWVELESSCAGKGTPEGAEATQLLWPWSSCGDTHNAQTRMSTPQPRDEARQGKRRCRDPTNL